MENFHVGLRKIKRKRRLIRKIVKNLRQDYSIQRVAKFFDLSFGAVRDLLFEAYTCKKINDLRKKLKVTRKLSDKQINKLKMVKELYDKYLTLEKTAEQLHLTRERIRQLLIKGEKYGLFEYELNREKKFKELLAIYTRDSLIKEIKLLISPSKICLKLHIKQSEFNKLLEHFNIDYKDYRLAATMGSCLEKYSQIADVLGHHPTTTEMNTKTEWRAIWGAIDRYWGNMENFRKEYGIERPIQKIHPNTLLAFQKSKEKRSFIKTEKKEKVLNLIRKEGPINATLIRNKLGLKPAMTWNYIRELTKEGLISKTGVGNQVKYAII